MKVAIVGSRDFMFPEMVISYIRTLPKDTIIVSGGARGVDTWAEKTAKELGMQTEIYPAQWDKFGLSAGIIRNNDIVKAADKVVAFWNGRSKGTLHTIKLAKLYDKLDAIFNE